MNKLLESKESIIVKELIIAQAKKILHETMKTTWQQSTIAERKLAIYAAEKESGVEHGKAHFQ